MAMRQGNRVAQTVGLLTTCLLVGVAQAGCAAAPPERPTPLVSAPSQYARDGVQFSYPGNWTLEEKTQQEEGEAPTRDISVGAKGNAGALIKVFEDAPSQVELDRFISEFSETLKAKVPDLVTLTDVTQSEVENVVGGEQRRGVRKQFLFEFFFKRFSVSVDFHRIDGATRSVFLVTVFGDQDDRVIPGFELIRQTLKVF